MEHFEELLAQKLKHAAIAETLAKPFLTEICNTAPITPQPLSSSRPTKSRNRILDKVNGYRQANPELDLPGAMDMVLDFVGARFLVHYIRDVRCLHEHICQVVLVRRDITLDGPCDDCISQPRSSGFRALIQRTHFMILPETWFPFELQVMTYLAHDWDKKQHIIYEYPDKVPQSVDGLFKEMSTKLLEVDNTFDQAKEILDEFLPRGGQNANNA